MSALTPVAIINAVSKAAKAKGSILYFKEDENGNIVDIEAACNCRLVEWFIMNTRGYKRYRKQPEKVLKAVQDVLFNDQRTNSQNR